MVAACIVLIVATVLALLYIIYLKKKCEFLIGIVKDYRREFRKIEKK